MSGFPQRSGVMRRAWASLGLHPVSRVARGHFLNPPKPQSPHLGSDGSHL